MAARRKADAERGAPGHRCSEPAPARSAQARARFFFALRPDRTAAVALAAIGHDLRGRYGGRSMHADDVHLTLAFVGMRPLAEAQPLGALIAGLPRELPAQPEPLALERLGSFGHGVVWIGPVHDAPQPQAAAQPPAAAQPLHALAERLRTRLLQAHVAFDDRPLRLHVTLVRGARDFRPDDAAGLLPEPIVPASWSLALGWSDPAATTGPRYAWQPAQP